MYLFFYLLYIFDHIFTYYCFGCLVLMTRFLADVRVNKGFVDFELRGLFFLYRLGFFISLSILFSLISDSTFLFWTSPYVWEDTIWTELFGEFVAFVVAKFATHSSSPISRLFCLSTSIPFYLRGVNAFVE